MHILQVSDPRAGHIEATTVGDLVARASQNWSHDAMVFPDERITYPQLVERANHFASAFIGLGVGYGDKIGIRMNQNADFYAAMLGAVNAGAIAVPINLRFKARELAHVILNADLSILLGSPDGDEVGDHVGLLYEALPELRAAQGGNLSLESAPMLRYLIINGKASESNMIGADSLMEAAKSVDKNSLEARRLGVSIRNTALIMYTSGTTSNPKGAMLSHEALVRVAGSMARCRFILTPEDTVWTPLPLYHIGGMVFALACWTVGATYVHTGRFEPDNAVEQLRGERPTVALPTIDMIWQSVISHSEFSDEDISSLRILYITGVPERLRQLQEDMPSATLMSAFGSTEAASILTMHGTDDTLEDRINTCGRPLPGVQIRVIDPETGCDVKAGETGELCYRGWSTFDGYYNAPETTSASFDADGFFHSGDLGTYSDSGLITFTGRLKDLLKVGGENVAASEVESFLLSHPAIAIAQVVAAPDARYSEVPAAFIELSPGAQASEQEIIDYCLGSISTFKVPRYIRFVEEWPMSGTKVRKYVLRDQIAAELKAAGIKEAPKLSNSSTA